MDIRLAPTRYIREPGITARMDPYLAGLGKKAMLVGGHTALSVAAGAVKESLKKAGIDVVSEQWYGGECSWENIDALAADLVDKGADFVIGIGGGKAIDTVKGAAYKINMPVVTVPTIAATCAAWTPLSIIYSPEGKYLESCRRSAQPNRVFVDDAIIGAAPVRYLVSGMGDTLAKWYETDVAVKKRGFNAATLSAHRLSLLCKDMINDYGVAASASVTEAKSSQELGHVIDAVIAVSGMVSDLGGEGCASAAAHPVAAGLTLIDIVHRMYHGEVVAFGVLCQLMLESKPDPEVNEFLDICQRLGLPMTLQDLGLDYLGGTELEEVAQKAIEAENINNMPFPVSRDMAAKAILAADAKGKAFREAN